MSVVEAKLSEPSDSQIKAFLEDVPYKVLPIFFSFIIIIFALKYSVDV